MIQRRREYGKREPSRDAHKIYIICEGKGTEPDYFAFFEGLSSNLQVITIPPTEGNDPLKLMERAKHFEIWLYYHFYDEKPNPEEVKKRASFKEYVDSVISGGFNFEKDPVRIEDAVANAERNFSRDKDGLLQLYTTEMFVLGKEIDGFVSSDVKKLRNKIS